jgi:hypothetical protein
LSCRLTKVPNGVMVFGVGGNVVGSAEATAERSKRVLIFILGRSGISKYLVEEGFKRTGVAFYS